MWINKQITLPSVSSLADPNVRLYALFGGQNAPLTKQGKLCQTTCDQVKSEFEHYAEWAK